MQEHGHDQGHVTVHDPVHGPAHGPAPAEAADAPVLPAAAARPWTRVVRWSALLLCLTGLSLVPFALFGQAMDAAVTSALSGSVTSPLAWWWAGALIVALLSADVLLPVPSSVLGMAAGGIFGMVAGTCVSWLGMTLGCVLAYWLGHHAGRDAMRRLVGADDWARVEAATHRRGAVVLALFRPVPVLAEASVLFAGAARMPRGRYLALTAAANLIVSAAHAALGVHAGGVLAHIPGGSP